jgi:hypothetical protein
MSMSSPRNACKGTTRPSQFSFGGITTLAVEPIRGPQCFTIRETGPAGIRSALWWLLPHSSGLRLWRIWQLSKLSERAAISRNPLVGFTRAESSSCWSKFNRAPPSGVEHDAFAPVALGIQALRRIDAMFEVERAINGLATDKRKAGREGKVCL